MNIKFKIRGVEELQAYLKTLPRGTTRAALQAFTEYVIGNASHGLKHPDPYKYASRAQAYGSPASDGAPAGYFSWKQFRYVAWKTHGFTDRGSQRTGNSTDAWQYVMVSDYNYSITNPEPGAYYTRDEAGQARQPRDVGWRKYMAVIQDNMAGAIRSANAAVKAWLNKK